jgi:perosamine synthetase
MSNINAAIGLIQLKKFERMNSRKIEIARQYDRAFADLQGVTLLRNDNYLDIGLFIYILRVKQGRNDLMDYLASRGVGSGIHYIPSHKFTFYKDKGNSLPVTDMIFNEILTLPLFPDITDEHVNKVIATVTEGVQEHG